MRGATTPVLARSLILLLGSVFPAVGETADISGTWSGQLLIDGPVYYWYRFHFTQSGSTISGTARLQEFGNPSRFLETRIVGTIGEIYLGDYAKVNLREAEILNKGGLGNDPLPPAWRLKSDIRIILKKSELSLYGPWGPDVIPLGHVSLHRGTSYCLDPGYQPGSLPDPACGSDNCVSPGGVLGLSASASKVCPQVEGVPGSSSNILTSSFPPGYWAGDKGSEEWGRRKGLGAREGRKRFHQIKGDDNKSKATDDYGVNPETGDVIDPEGEVIGNLSERRQ
jgi:hypothetical protein